MSTTDHPLLMSMINVASDQFEGHGLAKVADSSEFLTNKIHSHESEHMKCHMCELRISICNRNES